MAQDTDDFFVRIGQYQDNVFRTDNERRQIFYASGINRFVETLVLPYVPGSKIPTSKKGFFKRLFSSEYMVDIVAIVPKKEALEKMVKSNFVENNESAEKILDSLEGNSFPYKASRALFINKKTNSFGDKAYEIALKEAYYPDFGS